MSDIPNDDQPGFVAKDPEHCFACFRLIRPGQTVHMTIDFEVLCMDCASAEGVIRVWEDLAVGAKRDRPVIQRGEAAVRLVDRGIKEA